jgi:4-carboxymuconolactone decarboxylase
MHMIFMKEEAERAVKELEDEMGGFVPGTLKTIKEYHPERAMLIREIDRVMVTDGALNKKTKRLIALACVAVRTCEDCVYPQAKITKNYGASKEEIIEALNVAVLTGGVPSWSTAKKGIIRLFEEWEN